MDIKALFCECILVIVNVYGLAHNEVFPRN